MLKSLRAERRTRAAARFWSLFYHMQIKGREDSFDFQAHFTIQDSKPEPNHKIFRKFVYIPFSKLQNSININWNNWNKKP